MVWLISGGIAVLIIVATVCVWMVIVLLAEVGEEQDAVGGDFEFDSADQRRRGRGRASRF